MIEPAHLRDHVIDPALRHIGLHSVAALELLLGTAAQESACGRYLHQLAGGPALGIYQMEPGTYSDIWGNYLHYRSDLSAKVLQLAGARWFSAGGIPDPREMIGNLPYATAMARVHYLRVRDPLPAAGDLPRLAAYWKEHYNTSAGRGTVEEYQANARRYLIQGGLA